MESPSVNANEHDAVTWNPNGTSGKLKTKFKKKQAMISFGKRKK